MADTDVSKKLTASITLMIKVVTSSGTSVNTYHHPNDGSSKLV
jgi:hypothetical protein